MPEDASSNVFAELRASGVSAVLTIERVEDAVPLAHALVAGGVTFMELTLRTPVALDALRAIREHVPQMNAGVGTVLSREQVNEVQAAGAAFAMAPGISPDIVRAAQSASLPFAPGVATPTDIQTALDLDCRTLKFFPAEPSGGLAYLRTMAAPFAHLGVEFIPLGGVNAQNMRMYLESPLIFAIGGSWLAPPELVRKGDFAAITTLAQQASRIATEVRKGATLA